LEFNHYENWGHIGGGNSFIFNSIMESELRNPFTSDDTVIIMWTNISREDRYINGGWMHSGNIYTQNTYDKEWIKKFADERGYFIRDIAFIYAIKQLLEFKNINYIFLSMVDILNVDQYNVNELEKSNEFVTLYKDTLATIKPSIFDVVFNKDWNSRFFSDNPNSKIRLDPHPTPLEHLEYLDKVLPEIEIGSNTRKLVSNIDKYIRNSNRRFNGIDDFYSINIWPVMYKRPHRF
jgi:hypothetical protein